MDARDETTWLIIELTPQGERAADEGFLESVFRESGCLDPHHPIFIPCVSYEHRGRRSVLSVMEGYAFIGSGASDDSITRLTNSQYVSNILSRGKGLRRVFDTIPDSAVKDLRFKLNEMIGVELEEGMAVRVNGGPLLGVTGTIMLIYEDKASVLVSMRSINVVKDFPLFLLWPHGEGDE